MAKGRSRAQKLQLRAVHQAKAQAQAIISDSTENAPRPARSLPAVRKELETVQQRLKETEADLENCILSLEATHINLETKTIALQAAQGKSQALYRELRTTKQKLKRTQTTKVEMQSAIKLLQSVDLPTAKEDAAKALELLDNTMVENQALKDQLCHLIQSSAAEVSDLKNTLNESRKKVQALQKQVKCQPQALERAVEKAVKQQKTYDLLKKGVYTPEARALARLLVQAGCSQDYVGEVIQKICHQVGVEVTGKMSWRSVSQSILEGGVAAELQLVHEITNATDLTVSGDGTTHKHVNFQSWHVNYIAPSYSDDNSNEKHQSRLLGIFSMADHTSQSQVDGLINYLTQIGERFKSSPFAQHGKVTLLVDQFLEKLRGMNSDHAEDQKKVFALLKQLKEELAYETLGAEKLADMEPGNLFLLLEEVIDGNIDDAGGPEEWKKLSESERSERFNSSIKEFTIEHGKMEFEKLTNEQKKSLFLFIWVGCGMHKDMNAGKGGDAAMEECWKELEVPRPILLANKDNAPVIDGIDSDSEMLKPAEKCALNVTGSGATQLTLLVGLYVNHKDDKKGQQNRFCYFMEKEIGKLINFPDTSNTRYQSSGRAAGELLVHLDYYIKFLEFVHDSKVKKWTFNNMERNIYDALHDIPTITELCVLALYAQAITHPYMHQIRGPGTENVNMLELGPLHNTLQEHIQNVIDNPDLLLALTCNWTTGARDGKEWERPEVITAILEKSPELPHLKPLLVAYFKGAGVTWKRFTTEFAPGGVISLTGAEDRKKAWMPPTNDVNKGSLGSYRVFIQKKPKTSMHMYNAIAQYSQNQTEAFMQQHFTEAEHAFI